MTARHPFLERDSLVVNADYVTTDSGTGCVHIAPGFGADDYAVGRKYGLRISVPVDDRGYQTEEAGPYAGIYYEESNSVILNDMKVSGALFASVASSVTSSEPEPAAGVRRRGTRMNVAAQRTAATAKRTTALKTGLIANPPISRSGRARRSSGCGHCRIS